LNRELTGDIEPGDGDNVEWTFFGNDAIEHGLLLIHHDDDAIGDRYYPMAAMTVFGFGRPEGAERELTQIPKTFSVAFIDETRHDKIAELVRGIILRETVEILPLRR
jgi:hypothetical protein